MQYAENQVTRQPTKEAFQATGMLPLLFIPEGRTDSPPEGRWSPLTGPCALRGSPSKPAGGFRGYRPSMQALIGLSQPDGLTSWGISCLRTRPKGFPLVLWKPSVALLTESDRLRCHNTATYELTVDISGSEENRSWLLDAIFNLVMATGKRD